MPYRPTGEGIKETENIMRAKTTTHTRKLLIAALVALAPAGSAFAAMDCTGDPFGPYYKSFYADGQYQCTPVTSRQTGAQGPAGPIMSMDESRGAMAEEATRRADDPFADYRRAFTGD